jgi:hypothetical protein
MVVNTLAPSEKNLAFSSTPFEPRLYCSHPFPRGGVLETAWITWGGSGARAGRGRKVQATGLSSCHGPPRT